MKPAALQGSPPASAFVRVMRLPHATAMVVGTIIGASIFVQPSEVTARIPSQFGVFAVWIASGVLSLLGALVCAELASTFTRTGGVYVYLREAFSPAVGFLWGWAMFWVMHSGIIAAMATVFGRYTGFFVPLGDRGIRTVAVGAILVLSALNYAGVKRGSTVQTLFTACKVIAVVAVVVIGFTVGSSLPSHFERGAMEHETVHAHGFLLAVIAGLFAFGGWHVVTYTAEETVQPERTIPRALTFGIVIVTLCYVALNAVYFYVLPMDRILKSTRVAADAATALLGAPGGAAISGLVMFSVFGAMTGSILAAPRVYFAMARDGLLFEWVSQVHPRFHTPHRAIVLQAIWASMLVSSGTYRQLFTRVIFTEWIFFALMAAGLFMLRRRPDYRPVYRVWGFPWVPGIFIAASTIIVVNRMVSEPIDSLVGLGIVAAGIPVYYLTGLHARPAAGHDQYDAAYH